MKTPPKKVLIKTLILSTEIKRKKLHLKCYRSKYFSVIFLLDPIYYHFSYIFLIFSCYIFAYGPVALIGRVSYFLLHFSTFLKIGG